MSTENIVTGKFYRILKDATNDVWDRISFWTHADDVQTASGITLTNDLSAKDSKITTTQSDFATIESSSVSAHAYVIGNMLVYNNQLYRVTSAIAVGATLVPGTNIEAVSVGTLSNMLNTSDGKGFYFDQKDGSYGFYPTALKQASEFVPFGGTGGLGENKYIARINGAFSTGDIPTQNLYLNPPCAAVFKFSGKDYSALTLSAASYVGYCLFAVNEQRLDYNYASLDPTVDEYIFVICGGSGLSGYGDANISFTKR